MYRLFLALRYLRSRLVNLISIGGVMMGVAVLIVVVAIMDGFQAQVRAVVRGSLSHLILFVKTGPEHLLPFAQLEAKLREDEPHVVAAAPQIALPVFFEYDSDRVSAIGSQGRAWHQMQAIGVDPRRERAVSAFAENLLVTADPEDPFFHPDAARFEKTTVLVSRTFAENFGLGALDAEGRVVHPYGALRTDRGVPLEGEALLAACRELIGSDLRIMWGTTAEADAGERAIRPNSKNLVISGVYDAHDAVEDNSRLFFELGELRRMGNIQHEYLQARIKLDDYDNAQAVKRSLTDLVGSWFVVETWEDQKADFLRAVNNEKVLLVIVLSFIILLGGFIILATLTLTVVEKTKDIGVVAALGASRRGILSVFLFNGLLIGVLGALFGLGLGYWFTANVNWVKDRLGDLGVEIFPPNIYHFRDIPTVWDWPSVLSIMAGSVLVAFLAGLLPALRASRLDPVAALRYE